MRLHKSGYIKALWVTGPIGPTARTLLGSQQLAAIRVRQGRDANTGSMNMNI